MGGYLLQRLNRDTVFKDPVTDKDKTSKRGRINNSLLETVFLDGEIVKEYTLDQVRVKAARALE